ncbi:hypothetical protein [Undibacterium sp. TC9W]|uniref:hypothetical protein n=1 Tax=Undibacterium sp. TC9W TaxID=3413053 RepID=UPI003BF4014B
MAGMALNKGLLIIFPGATYNANLTAAMTAAATGISNSGNGPAREIFNGKQTAHAYILFSVELSRLKMA